MRGQELLVELWLLGCSGQECGCVGNHFDVFHKESLTGLRKGKGISFKCREIALNT